MQREYPYTITNAGGEKIIFLHREGDKVTVENFVTPGSGPPMHVHFKQEECLTVISGVMGYQVLGEEPKYARAGETVLFKRGTPHKFWAAENQHLHCTGWVQPVHTFEFFIDALFTAQAKSGSDRPEAFDGAYLITRYAREYDMTEMPLFVKKVIIPLTYYTGKLLGKYSHFKDAPEPVR